MVLSPSFSFVSLFHSMYPFNYLNTKLLEQLLIVNTIHIAIYMHIVIYIYIGINMGNRTDCKNERLGTKEQNFELLHSSYKQLFEATKIK